MQGQMFEQVIIFDLSILLQLIGHSNYAMVANEGTLSLTNIKAMKMKSYTSLLAHHTTEESTIDIAVSYYLVLERAGWREVTSGGWRGYSWETG